MSDHVSRYCGTTIAGKRVLAEPVFIPVSGPSLVFFYFSLYLCFPVCFAPSVFLLGTLGGYGDDDVDTALETAEHTALQ